jgi:hypothetical protein
MSASLRFPITGSNGRFDKWRSYPARVAERKTAKRLKFAGGLTRRFQAHEHLQEFLPHIRFKTGGKFLFQIVRLDQLNCIF